MTLEKMLLMSLRSPYLDDAKVYPPLGLLYLKSAIEKNSNVEVDLTDNYNYEPSYFSNYDLIGLSVMTPQREESKKLLNLIKSNYPEKKVVIGGPHALHYFQEVQNDPYDYIVTNDGQRSIIKIINETANRIETDRMDKITWMNQPRPDRTSQKAKEFLSSYHYELQGRKAGTMLTATGCPERCTFCEDAMTAVRWSSMDNLKHEMNDLIDLGYGGVYLFDDLFAIAIDKVKPIVNELKDRDLIFRCNGQARYFTKWGEDFAKLLGENGCVEIAFGHETGSQKILDNIVKRTTIQQNYDSIKYAKKHGINVKSFMLLGLPGEDRQTLADTEKFIKTAGMDDFQLAIYMPFKGTQIRDAMDRGEDIDLKMDAKGKDGEITGAYGIKGGETSYEVGTKALTPEDLKEFRNYLVDKYKPKSHQNRWKPTEDKFFDIAHDTGTEYGMES